MSEYLYRLRPITYSALTFPTCLRHPHGCVAFNIIITIIIDSCVNGVAMQMMEGDHIGTYFDDGDCGLVHILAVKMNLFF